MRLIPFVVALVAALTGCPDEPPRPPTPATSDAGAAGALPQAPQIEVDDLAKVLPKDENGNSILWKVGSELIGIGPPPTPGPNTAVAACRDLSTSCAIATKGDTDGCHDKLPVCATNEPWNEEKECCPEACVHAYREERRLGASKADASIAVFGSDHECFPGLKEWYHERGGKPYLAPRRAPVPLP